jgi:hypothetical protein
VNLAFRQARINQPAGRRLRIADHSVAPMKGRELRQELRFGEQIAKLALTANDNRHFGEARSRNQGEIRIEIKRLRNGNLTSPQMARQPKTRSEGLLSIQAAADAKLLNVRQGVVRQDIQESACFADATQVQTERSWTQGSSQDGKLTLTAAGVKTLGHQENVRRRCPRTGQMNYGRLGVSSMKSRLGLSFSICG